MSVMYPELAKMLIDLRNRVVLEATSRRGDVVDFLSKTVWIPMKGDEIPCERVAAVDSSFILFESRIAVLYALQGISQVHSIENGKIVTKDVDRFCDAGVIEYAHGKSSMRKSAFKKALTAYAYLNEVKSVERIVLKTPVDVVLFDSSILSFLLTRRDIANNLIVRSVNDSKTLEEVYASRLEALESLAKRFTIVFVAKSSSVSFYTESESSYTDFQLFELARLYKIQPFLEAGYSAPKEVEFSEKVKKFLGIREMGLRGFIVSYARFQKNSQVFQLTIPFIDKKPDIEKTIACIKAFSPAGYPIPLEFAHRVSKLSRRSLRDFLIKIGMPIASGREFLEL
ncbi:DNA double-strand break repair nuclease NurA [Ignisphaera sp. 4213-co]|uniref:DNA double-strand break repair nuclease NurA n=1 Tax=Ignisphaera cupida TaxID=3050454 RepID=A0ABD4Z609_9CREN|nr:DNA double-strand break repair nuclease NurA [Ignisphaera sp. 4213-co]MDK6028751.1 DNA double-strand break repair nuclease NurA [Ignisphaera sp. 4213-co]